MSQTDRDILRPLVETYQEICQRPVMNERRDLWRRHNSMERTRPLIYIRAFAFRELPESRCLCQDPVLRAQESALRKNIYWNSLEDDAVFEPWLSVPAVRPTPGEGPWGLPIEWQEGHVARGAKAMKPSLNSREDLEKMVTPRHMVDEAATAERVSKIHDAVGDLISIHVDRSPLWYRWHADLSTDIARLRGLDTFMLDMVMDPALLHDVLTFMRDGVLKAHQEAEDAGHWTLAEHDNQAMTYAKELADPAIDAGPAMRKDLWTFCASQETTLVGPAQFNEFMLQYQLPIIEKFGLCAYGCCEDLTLKIPVLRQIPNLRRIAVSPMADLRRCIEQIGTDYIASWRPSPSDMVGYGFSPEFIRQTTRQALEIARANDCIMDITLKDVETVQNDPVRVPEYTRITREVIEEYAW